MVRGEMVYTRDIQSIIAAFVRDLWGMTRKQKYIIYTKYVETVQLDRTLPVYLNILWSNEEYASIVWQVLTEKRILVNKNMQ